MENQNNDTYCIDKPIDDKILEEIKNYQKLFFGNRFNFSVNNLPSSIKKITFNNYITLGNVCYQILCQ